MGDVRGDAFVYVGVAGSLCMESGRWGYIWVGALSRLVSQSFMGTMVSARSTLVDRVVEHCRHVCIRDAAGLVVEAIRCFLYLARPLLAIA